MRFVFINLIVIICFAFVIFFGAISFSTLLERESKVDALYWQYSTTEKDTKEDIEKCKITTDLLNEKAKVYN
jgi:cell division protein FtsB